MKYLLHYNDWWWGFSENYIFEDGKGIIELQYDNDNPNVIFLKGLSVLETARYNGLGTQIMRFCDKVAMRKGKKILRLSVENDATHLFHWYKKLGYMEFEVNEKTTEMIKVL